MSNKIEHQCRKCDPRKLAFSPLSLYKFVDVGVPPKAGGFLKRPIKNPTLFRKFYDRGDFPIFLKPSTSGNKIGWKADIGKLDYQYYLPLFFDGLSETEHPYEFFACEGIHDLLNHGAGKVLPVIPQLIIPIKKALSTKNPKVCRKVMVALQHLIVSDNMVGEALVPYYRQLLPVFNVFVNKNKNLGDGIEYGQQKGENIGDLVTKTLQMLELHGGAHALINIKYMVPTYVSCVLNM